MSVSFGVVSFLLSRVLWGDGVFSVGLFKGFWWVGFWMDGLVGLGWMVWGAVGVWGVGVYLLLTYGYVLTLGDLDLGMELKYWILLWNHFCLCE